MSKLFVVPPKEARKRRWIPTTVKLDADHRVLIAKLQIKRMKRTKRKPSMNEILIEAIELLVETEKIEDND